MRRFKIERRRLSKAYNKRSQKIHILSLGADLFFLLLFYQIEELFMRRGPLYPLFFFSLWWCTKLLPSLFLYRLRRRFALCLQGARDWAKKKLKEAALFLPVSLFFAHTFFWAARREGGLILLLLLYMAFLLLLTKILPELILPIFYAKRPLKDEKIRSKVLALFERSGESVNEVWVVYTSKESVQMNAALAGLGKSRCILFSDTMLSTLSEEEIESILAHELGHKRRGHFGKLFLLSSMNAALFLLLLHLLSTSFPALKERLSCIFVLLLFYGILTGPFFAFIKRRLEEEADIFSFLYTNPSSFISAMIAIADKNLSPLKREGILGLFSSHPGVLERIRRASSFRAQQHQGLHPHLAQ